MENVPILYINLDRSKERKVRMEEQFKQYNIKNYKRVPAFDGRKLFSDSSLRAKTVELPKDMKQSSGEIGCSLSHLRAAEMALEIDAPYASVMEDGDIHLTFYKAVKTSMKIVSQAPKDWQVLQLTINNVRVCGRSWAWNGLCPAEKSLEHGRVPHQPARLPADRRGVLLPEGLKAHYKLPGASNWSQMY